MTMKNKFPATLHKDATDLMLSETLPGSSRRKFRARLMNLSDGSKNNGSFCWEY